MQVIKLHATNKTTWPLNFLKSRFLMYILNRPPSVEKDMKFGNVKKIIENQMKDAGYFGRLLVTCLFP